MPRFSGFSSLDTLPEQKITDKITGRIAAGEKGMIAWWKFKAGAHVGAHSHDNEQIAWMISGKMEFRLGDERRICGPGDIVVIPGGIEHEAYFPEDTEVIDIFTPPREDMLGGGDLTYMKAR